jgi:hypothetical protein
MFNLLKDIDWSAAYEAVAKAFLAQDYPELFSQGWTQIATVLTNTVTADKIFEATADIINKL